MATILQIKNLRTHFFTEGGVVKAVDGVSYDVREGETLALVGESGCGKSVSALSILRLIPDPPGRIMGGEVIFKDRDLLQLSTDEMRRVRGNHIGMVFQEPMSSLNPVLSIGKQLTESVMLHRRLTHRQARRHAADLLGMVGISSPNSQLTRYPHHFSGGMRQRVMIAIALSCNPSLIIADEPTTALDVTVQAQILDLMKNLCKENNVALMIITHNLGVVARYADRINIMYAGRIIEHGTAREIYRNPRHPYTIGLLRSVPRLDRDRADRLDPIEGQPPDLARLPEGCHFRPRCQHAIERCAAEYPPLSKVDGGHESACWVASELGQEAVTP